MGGFSTFYRGQTDHVELLRMFKFHIHHFVWIVLELLKVFFVKFVDLFAVILVDFLFRATFPFNDL